MTPITAAALCVHACGIELQVAAVAVDSRPCCALVVLPPDPADAAPSVCNGGRLQSLLSSHKQLLGHLLMRHSIIIQASLQRTGQLVADIPELATSAPHDTQLCGPRCGGVLAMRPGCCAWSYVLPSRPCGAAASSATHFACTVVLHYCCCLPACSKQLQHAASCCRRGHRVLICSASATAQNVF
jgi:hypothetical protein